MRPIFIRQPPRQRPWWKWVVFPFLLTRWAWGELREGVDELFDSYVPPGTIQRPPCAPPVRRYDDGHNCH